jgi:hypothetical protein
VVVGIAAQAADHPADGIGLALQGFLARFLGGEALLQIGNREGVIGFIGGVQALGELGDPAGFGLELGAELPEGGAARGFLRRACSRREAVPAPPGKAITSTPVGRARGWRRASSVARRSIWPLRLGPAASP